VAPSCSRAIGAPAGSAPAAAKPAHSSAGARLVLAALQGKRAADAENAAALSGPRPDHRSCPEAQARLANRQTTAAACSTPVLTTGPPSSFHRYTSYAVWTGVGTAGAFLAGVVLFGEQISALRVVSVTLIILGMIGLRLAGE